MIFTDFHQKCQIFKKKNEGIGFKVRGLKFWNLALHIHICDLCPCKIKSCKIHLKSQFKEGGQDITPFSTLTEALVS